MFSELLLCTRYQGHKVLHFEFLCSRVPSFWAEDKDVIMVLIVKESGSSESLRGQVKGCGH